VPAPSSGLARITIRAPRRRVDLAVPDQVPLAEILPDVLRRAGEAPADAGGPEPHGALVAGGLVLRRGDGAALAGDSALSHQGVRDGDVLYLVPRSLTWPEPDYDDVVEEIATGARSHSRSWSPRVTRAVSLGAAGFVLLVGLAALLASGPPWTAPGLVALGLGAVLIVAGGLLSRALGDGVAGAAAAGYGLPYVAAAGVLLVGSSGPLRGLGEGALLVGSAALLLASVIGAVGVGHGLRLFAAGITAGVFGAIGALLGYPMTGAGAAAVLIVALVAGIGLAPLLAVRLGKLPLPVVSADPELIAGEPRPERPRILATVIRADEILAGALLGIAVLVAACVVVVASGGGASGRLLGALAAAALLLRARLFPAVAARLPLLVAGLLGLAAVGWIALGPAGVGVRLLGVVLAFAAVASLLGSAAVAYRRRGAPSPYLGRIADVLDVVAVVSLAPLACGVLGLFSLVRGLAG